MCSERAHHLTLRSETYQKTGIHDVRYVHLFEVHSNLSHLLEQQWTLETLVLTSAAQQRK